MKKALITGVTGQDGAYLAELLLSKGYEVHGIKRRTSLFNTSRIDHLFHDIHEKGKPFYLHHGDMTDSTSLTHIIQKVQPDEMSKCKNHIIANSSFSWWGAWLSENPHKEVIAPKQWFNALEADTRDLIPNNWKRI